MNILAVDTSSKSASVCIMKEGKIVAESLCNASLTHSQTFMAMVEDALNVSRSELNEIDYFVSTKGPGSFTGLRIGLGAVKAMAHYLKKPCVAISTLEALAYNYVDTDGYICPVMDARCSQVYTALFKSENGVITRLCEDKAIAILDLAKELPKEKIRLVGCGSDITFNALKDFEGLNLLMSSESQKFLRSSSVALCGAKKIQNGEDIVSANDLVPSYLRLPQAQRELIKKSQLAK